MLTGAETDVPATIAALRRDNPGFAGRTVSVAVAVGDRYHVYIRRDDRVRLLETIGFTNAEQTEPDMYPTRTKALRGWRGRHERLRSWAGAEPGTCLRVA